MAAGVIGAISAEDLLLRIPRAGFSVDIFRSRSPTPADAPRSIDPFLMALIRLKSQVHRLWKCSSLIHVVLVEHFN